MGLILRRLGFLGLAVAAGLLPLLKRPGDRGAATEASAIARLDLLSWRRYQARNIVLALEARDSARAFSARLRPGSPKPVIGLSGFGAGADTADASRRIEQVWRDVAGSDPSVRVGALLMRRGAGREHILGTGYSGTFIRPGDGGPECIAILSERASPAGIVETSSSSVRSALAPCVLLASFGPPGPTLGAWLGARRWVGAQSMAWLTRPRDSADGDRSGPWQPIWDPTASYRVPGARSLSRLGVTPVVLFRAPDYALGASPLRCLTGSIAACAASVTDTTFIMEAAASFPSELVGVRGVIGTSRWIAARPLAGWWLSDLIREFGRDRFARFWTSSEQLEAAFRTAFGEELGRYQYRWARKQWEQSWYARQRSAEFTLGVGLSPGAPLAVVLWSAAALALVGWRSQRRTMEP